MATTSPSASPPSHSCCTNCPPKRQCSTARLWPAMPMGARTSPGCTCVGPDRAQFSYGRSICSLSTARTGRPQPLVKRQARLQVLMEHFGCPAVSLSEPFEDGLALLRVAEERGLEGVVSKRRDAPYRSGEFRIGGRSRRSRGAKPIGSGGDCMNGANFRSVADGQFECQGENRLALFVCDDKGLVVSRSSKTGLFPHDLASALRGFLAYLVQVIKLNAFLIEHCLACVFDVKEVTWHR